MNLPTAKEINPLGDIDLDGKFAEKHFLGKSIDEATELFKTSSFAYLEDLMWMGPIAFEFYLQAVYNYISSSFAKDDFSTISWLITTFKYRLECKEYVLKSTFPIMNTIIIYILENSNKFIEDTYDEGIWKNEVIGKIIFIKEKIAEFE